MMKLAAPVRITKPYSLERTAILALPGEGTCEDATQPWGTARQEQL